MGNRYTTVQPLLESSEPWVMITYDPGPQYKKFSYYERCHVYTNKQERMSYLSMELAPALGSAEYTVSNKTILSATQNINISGCKTVKELVEELFQKCCPENLELVAADKIKILYYWITAQDVKHFEYDLTVDFETVNFQLQKLQEGKNSYAAFFSLLCFYADVPCVIIRGHVKGGRYEVNKPLTDNLIREWNAVLVDGEWRFVDTLWGRIYHGDLLTREEWYLFPDPNHLKYSHFPENKFWQLLKQPISEDEFIRLPMLKKRFFEMDMELLSDTKGYIACSSGELEINFQLNAANIDDQQFCCVISRKNDSKNWEEERPPEKDQNTQQLYSILKTTRNEQNDEARTCRDVVLDRMTPSNDQCSVRDDQDGTSSNIQLNGMAGSFATLTVKVRFLRTGYHKLEIVGCQREDEDYDWVAIYHVNVTSVPNSSDLFQSDQLPLEVARQLKLAIDSMNIRELRNALNSADSKKVEDHSTVKPKYNEASRLLEKLLEKYRKIIEKIGLINNQRIANLKSYSSPDLEIVRVMKAVFILLGESEDSLKNWDDIKIFIKAIGQDSVTKRIQNFDMKAIPGRVIKSARTALGDLNTMDALKKAEDVAVFANWVETVLNMSN